MQAGSAHVAAQRTHAPAAARARTRARNQPLLPSTSSQMKGLVGQRASKSSAVGSTRGSKSRAYSASVRAGHSTSGPVGSASSAAAAASAGAARWGGGGGGGGARQGRAARCASQRASAAVQ